MSERFEIPWDWFPGEVPANVQVGEDVFIDSSYDFEAFDSEREPGMIIGDGVGIYDRATFVVGPAGQITAADYSVFNSAYIYCHERVTVGRFGGPSWGTVITDHWIDPAAPLDDRRRILEQVARDPLRRLPPLGPVKPVTIEENVIVGFESVVLPGVTIGRGSIVGCRSVVTQDIPPYSVVIGNPARVVRTLEADDTPEAIAAAFDTYLRKDGGLNIRGED